MTQAGDQVSAPVPFSALAGLGYKSFGVMKQTVPGGHQGPNTERKSHLGRRRGGRHRRLRHQVGVNGSQVLVTGFGKRGEWKSRVEVAPVARDAFAHGALKSGVSPQAQTGLGVGGEVGGKDAAERRLHGQTAGIRHAARGGVATGAVAGGGQLPAALDGRLRVHRANTLAGWWQR